MLLLPVGHSHLFWASYSHRGIHIGTVNSYIRTHLVSIRPSHGPNIIAFSGWFMHSWRCQRYVKDNIRLGYLLSTEARSMTVLGTMECDPSRECQARWKGQAWKRMWWPQLIVEQFAVALGMMPFFEVPHENSSPPEPYLWKMGGYGLPSFKDNSHQETINTRKGLCPSPFHPGSLVDLMGGRRLRARELLKENCQRHCVLHLISCSRIMQDGRNRIGFQWHVEVPVTTSYFSGHQRASTEITIEVCVKVKFWFRMPPR